MTTPPTTPQPDASAPRKRPPPRQVEVVRITPLSPRMVRMTFNGREMQTFAWSGPASHLKLIVPEEGVHEVAMPTAEGPRSPNIRTYTPRQFEASTGALDIDFVLHDHGPAGRWASRARVGDRLVVIGPGPAYHVDADATHCVLAGDCTALPAIETILAVLAPTVVAHVLIEVDDGREERRLHSAGTVAAQWLRCTESPGAVLESALRAVTPALPRESTRVYVGCESAAVRRIRRALLHELGFDKRAITTRGYWKQGVANNPDGDYGEDPQAFIETLSAAHSLANGNQ